MTGVRCGDTRRHGGIRLHAGDPAGLEAATGRLLDRLDALGLTPHVRISIVSDHHGASSLLRLDPEFARHHVPDGDTLGLGARLHPPSQQGAPDPARTDPGIPDGDRLERETLAAMLAGPVAFDFPNERELFSALRMRANIVSNGSRTALAFHTMVADRPPGYWDYAEDRGFTVKPGRCLLEALTEATQPDASGRLYPFSCCRATEYVILLGVAQELRRVNPQLLQRLQRHWETRAITADRFRASFLREVGSLHEPLPARYYVPGDRVWFRNPDDASSDAVGYEGSWVIYLGGGLFTNFWKRDRPFTLESKCIEVFHWRHATYRDDAGEVQVDEARVEALVREAREDPRRCAGILETMMRWRDPPGVYADGGCIDRSREHPRCVHPGSADLDIPELQP